MIRSLLRYTRDVAALSLKGNFHYLSMDALRYFHGEETFLHIPEAKQKDLKDALEQVMEWLLIAQDRMNDSGIGSYHLASGWSSSYPETTGYIIPTLINYGVETGDDRYLAAAVKAADFLMEIQKTSGGWQGGRMNDDKPEIVFNTGQVLRGLMAVYLLKNDDRYMDAACKGADWLCQIQHPYGYWKQHALMQESRVYDSYVDSPLLSLFSITRNEKYKDAARKNLQWIVEKKMHPNGWFEDCDNTMKHNDRPILHTIAYTFDGLIESDELLRDGSFLKSAKIGADVLKRQLLEKGRLYGRYDKDWKGSEYFLCTGAAQVVIAWLRLFGISGDKTYLQAGDKALDILVHIQRRTLKERQDSRGAIPGSFPIWGRYEPFAFPNWASKFFADALMMRLQIKE